MWKGITYGNTQILGEFRRITSHQEVVARREMMWNAKGTSVKKCEENKVQQRTKENERVESSASVIKEKFICPRLRWDRN